MTEDYQIVQLEKPDDAAWEAIGGGLHEYNVAQAGPSQHASVCLVVQDAEKKTVGGLIGVTHWGWLYIELLFLREELRGLGYGHRLLTLAEEEGRRLGAKKIYLDTFSFQAPEFYKEHGYRIFGELADFPPGHTRYYLTKDL